MALFIKDAKPLVGEEVEFRRVFILQRFCRNGDLCQRIDRCLDRFGPYNAVVLGGEDGPRRVHVMEHEKVTVID